MLASKEQIKEYYRQVLLANDSQLVCCNPEYPIQEVPEEISVHSLSTLQPLKHHAIQPKDKILDIGCGAGADCFLVAYRGGAGVTAIGIDMVDELIDRAHELKAKYDVRNVDFINASPPPIALDSESFDLVIMNYSFHLFNKKKELLREVARLLKKNGQLIVADSFAPKKFRADQEVDDWLMHAGPAVSIAEFQTLAASADIEVIRFVREDLPHLPAEDVVGYMICGRK